METTIIVMLLIISIIFLIILIDYTDKNKSLNIIIQDCTESLYKSKKENEKLKSKNANFKNQIEEQYKEYCKNINSKESTIKFRESKIVELETKYKTSIDRIVEKEAVITLRDNQIIELEKTKKEYSQRVYNLQTQRDNAKHEAIDKAKQAVELCNEMAKDIKALNLELESIESDLISKLNP
jgi:chromosome segregation ATPase